ncbi:Sphingosine-1-phosphate lyase [Diplonema papillatum]|nr:Sphingosine-1-phosphate lyase [Diplonema papillatum]
MDQVSVHVTKSLALIDQRFSSMRPCEVLVSGMAFLYLGQQVAALLRQGPTEIFENAKCVFFFYMRKYFGGLLGYDQAIAEATDSFVKEFGSKTSQCAQTFDRLPTAGNTREEVLSMCKKLAELNCDFSKGQYSGSIYHGGMDGYTEFINEAMGMHQWTNPLHAGQFAGVRKMESEVISMCVKMFNGGENACGAMTSGGTESILLAIRAYKEYAKNERGITRPELVVSVTAHAAFDKACEYFGIRIRHANMDPQTCKVDMKHLRSLVTSNTICIVGSAPHFPHGIIDPITQIADFARPRGIPVHVDACLGGFVIAFMEKAGLALDEKFDFRVPGVTSISCDTHKYGFAPKGSSVIMYSDPRYRKEQMYTQPNWPGGIYASPTLAGSRVGNVVAGTWAAMMHHGEEGYVKTSSAIVSAARFISKECSAIEGLQVMGKPLLSVVAVKSDTFDIYRLAAMMHEKDWELNQLQFPSALHLAVTNLHAVNDMEHARRFVRDMRDCCAELLLTKDEKATGSAALYGTSQQVPDRKIIADIARTYFDVYYDVNVDGRFEALTKSV